MSSEQRDRVGGQSGPKAQKAGWPALATIMLATAEVFAHGSSWHVSAWLATTGITAAGATSASYAVGTEAVSPEKGSIVGTINNTADGLGMAITSASAGYVPSLREFGIDVATGSGPVIARFPVEETFTWSLMIVGVAALIGVAAAFSIRSRRLRVEARTVGSEPSA